MGHQAFLLPMGEMRDTGAGFFPLLIAAVTGLLAILALIPALKEMSQPLKTSAAPVEPFRWWNLVVICCGPGRLRSDLGRSRVPGQHLLFMLLLVKVIETQTWTKSLIAALITAVVSELFFNVLLGAQIPKGILGL